MKLFLSGFFLTFCFTTAAQLNPMAIGVIHPGDSIVVKYDVTINNPLVPPNAPSVINQGTVSGSNFSSIVTDDPDTGPAADPTVTLLNLFPLPVTLTGFKAVQSGNQVILNWKTTAEYNLLRYEIERSSDGITFSKIGEVPARNSHIADDYHYTDVQPFGGNNYYRLRILDNDGTKKFTAVVRVRIGGSSPDLHIFPNPVTGLSINMQMQNMVAGQYTLRLYNLLGQVVFTRLVNHPGGTATEIIYLPVTTAKGIYQAEINGPETKKTFRMVLL